MRNTTLLVCLIVFPLCACNSTRPAPLSNEANLYEVERDPGMGVSVGRWQRVFQPWLKPSEQWTVRIYADGVAEVQVLTCRGRAVWRDLRSLSGMELAQLQSLVTELRNIRDKTARYFVKRVEDVAYDGIILHTGKSHRSYFVQRRAGTGDADEQKVTAIIDFIESRYELPRTPACRW